MKNYQIISKFRLKWSLKYTDKYLPSVLMVSCSANYERNRIGRVVLLDLNQMSLCSEWDFLSNICPPLSPNMMVPQAAIYRQITLGSGVSLLVLFWCSFSAVSWVWTISMPVFQQTIFLVLVLRALLIKGSSPSSLNLTKKSLKKGKKLKNRKSGRVKA